LLAVPFIPDYWSSTVITDFFFRIRGQEEEEENEIEKETKTCLKYQILLIQYCDMASRTSNQAWSKGLDAGVL